MCVHVRGMFDEDSSHVALQVFPARTLEKSQRHLCNGWNCSICRHRVVGYASGKKDDISKFWKLLTKNGMKAFCLDALRMNESLSRNRYS